MLLTKEGTSGRRVVAVTVAASPLTEALTARTAKVYSVPFSRPVTVYAVVVAPLPVMSVKLVPAVGAVLVFRD